MPHLAILRLSKDEQFDQVSPRMSPVSSWLFYLNRIHRANLHTRIAADAFFLVYGVYFKRSHGYGIRRAMLRALGASYAVFGDQILNKCFAFTCRAAFFQMGLILVPEITQGREYRVGSCLP